MDDGLLAPVVDSDMECGFQFTDRLRAEFCKIGTAGRPIIFRSELGDYVPFEIVTTETATVVLLLEAGK